MYRKLDLIINGKYVCSSNRYRTCKEFVREVRLAKHIEVASAPKSRYVTIYDYDKVVARVAKN